MSNFIQKVSSFFTKIIKFSSSVYQIFYEWRIDLLLDFSFSYLRTFEGEMKDMVDNP